METRIWRGWRTIVVGGLLLAAGSVGADTPQPPPGEAAEVWGRTTVARPAAEWDEQGKPAKIDFDFGDFKMWARKKGGWQIEGWLHHRGLLCGTYYVAVRFGIGDPACNNVKWLDEPRYVSQRTQCNNASVLHSGGDLEFPHAAQFADVTCAERIIRCTGNCQLSFQGDKPGVPHPTQPLGP
jgi:hypothetical protein